MFGRTISRIRVLNKINNPIQTVPDIYTTMSKFKAKKQPTPKQNE